MYGIEISGIQDLQSVGMLVHVQVTPLGSSGEYTPPEMTKEQQERYIYVYTCVYSDRRWAQGRMWAGSYAEKYKSVLAVPDKETGKKITWMTSEVNAALAEVSIEAILIWRIPKSVRTRVWVGQP